MAVQSRTIDLYPFLLSEIIPRGDKDCWDVSRISAAIAEKHVEYTSSELGATLCRCVVDLELEIVVKTDNPDVITFRRWDK